MSATVTATAPAKLSAADVLARLEAAGLHLRAEGELIYLRPPGLLTDELRALVRAHKAELLQIVAKPATVATVAAANPQESKGERLGKDGTGPLSDPAAEARRKRVVAMLAGNPALRLAAVCDAECDPVPVAIAIRGNGTCEVNIPAARFYPFKLLELVAKHGGTVLH